MPIRVDHHDSSLGQWLLARWSPGSLRGLVEGILYFEGRMERLRERHFPDVAIGRLRDRTGWSKSRMTRTFREQIGVTPKTLARLVRFRRALELVGDDDRRFSAVALDAGYYDQPHFNAEFRDLSGFTPGEYRAALRFPHSVSLAEHAS